ncbi:MAG TPA: hypothetical protein DEA08_04235, partial [Planctomycetes bacterium]|nr:hypothetical protein [Planctomycetota bacterium]
PSITAPPAVVVACTSPSGQAVPLGTPVVSDNCDPDPAVSNDAPALFTLGTTTVTWTATDATGNQASATQLVTVEDRAPPVLTCPPALELEAPPGGAVPTNDPELVAWAGQATATDECDAAPVVSWSFTGPFPVGSETDVTFRATDRAGNEATCDVLVRVVEVGLTITSPAPDSCHAGPVTVTYEAWAGASVTISGTRTLAGVAHPVSGGSTFSDPGRYELVVRAESVRGAATAQLAFVIDTTAPVVSITNPVATPHTEPYPLSVYRYVPDLCGKCSPECQRCGPGAGVRSWRPSPAAATHSPSSGGHAFWLPDLPGGPKYVFKGTPRLNDQANGDLLLEATIVSAASASKQWEVTLWLTPSATPGPKLELHSQHYAPQGPIDPATWSFYVLDEARSGFKGKGAFSGKQLTLIHRPTDKRYGFQLGLGANGKNLKLGISGWLGYRGSFSADRGDLNVDLAALSQCPGDTWRPEEAEATHTSYSGGHAFWLPDLPGGPVYRFQANPKLERRDGALLLEAKIKSATQPNKQWDVTLWLVPSQQPGPKLELDPQHYAPVGPIDPSKWELFVVDESRSTFKGRGGFHGKTLQILHRPASRQYGFQLGEGANGKNLKFGISGWLGYRGSYSSDRGDLNADLLDACRHPDNDLPLTPEYTVADEDGVAGGVESVRVLLDGQEIPADAVLTERLFCDLGLPVLGSHVLRVEATDCAGNVGHDQVVFEFALIEREGRLLSVDGLKGSEATLTARFCLPCPPTGCPLDPTFAEVVASTLKLTALDTGKCASPTRTTFDAASGCVLAEFSKADLKQHGKLGKRFRLTGRFFNSTGPVFLVETASKKGCGDKGHGKSGHRCKDNDGDDKPGKSDDDDDEDDE